jgi:aspartyl protease family protein
MFRSIVFMALAIGLLSFGATLFLARHMTQPMAVPTLLGFLHSSSKRRDSARPDLPAGNAQIAIAPDSSGNYHTDVEIDGHFIHMMVDTGATYVSLTDADANAVGLRPRRSDYTYRTMTANGMGVAAKVRIAELRIGSMQIDNIEAFVMPPGVLGTSLLGMSALRRLGSVEISSGQLVLRQ